MLRVREEMQALEEEMQGVLSDIENNDMSRNREAERLDIDLSDRRAKERKRVNRDAAKMLKDASNEVSRTHKSHTSTRELLRRRSKLVPGRTKYL